MYIKDIYIYIEILNGKLCFVNKEIVITRYLYCIFIACIVFFSSLPIIIQSKYLLLDDILADEKHSKALAVLESCLTKNMLLKVCSCKGDKEYTAYKLDEEKALNWLSKKVSRQAVFTGLKSTMETPEQCLKSV